MGMFADLLHKIFGHATPPPAPPAPKKEEPAESDDDEIDEEIDDELAEEDEDSEDEDDLFDDEDEADDEEDEEADEEIEEAAEAEEVDVTGILDSLAAKHRGEHLDWRKSIVDLMKLVGMDSSLASRRELAEDLGYTGSTSDSAAMNVWLHKEVIKKLAEHGGSVPPELLH